MQDKNILMANIPDFYIPVRIMFMSIPCSTECIFKEVHPQRLLCHVRVLEPVDDKPNGEHPHPLLLQGPPPLLHQGHDQGAQGPITIIIIRIINLKV